jgi:polysaccharide biosynthesis protein PslJ
MSEYGRGSSAEMIASAGAPPRLAHRIDAVTLLTVYTLLLMALPSALVFSPLGGSGGPATIFSALLMGYYIVIWLHPGFKVDRERQPVRVAGVLFACVTLAAYVSANRHTMPSLEANGADRGIITMAGWLGVLLIGVDGIDSADRLRTLLRRIVIGGTAMATLGVTQFLTGLDATKYIIIPGLTRQVAFTDLLTRDNLNRPSATAAHPLEFAAVLAMCLPLAIHQARYAPPELRRRRWLQVAVMGAALPMTVSRSAFLALTVAALVLLPTWPKAERRRAYVVMVISAGLMWVAIPGLLGTIRNLFFQVGTDTSSASRTGAYAAAGPYVAQHPWFGRGFGTFLPQTYVFLDDQYLGTMIETGIIGLLALLALFITGWITARSARRASADIEARDLAQCLAASIAVATVTFWTFDAMSFAIAPGLTFMLLGCAGATWRLVHTGQLPERSVRDSRVGSGRRGWPSRGARPDGAGPDGEYSGGRGRSPGGGPGGPGRRS